VHSVYATAAARPVPPLPGCCGGLKQGSEAAADLAVYDLVVADLLCSCSRPLRSVSLVRPPVNISSSTAYLAVPQASAYSASKFAVRGYSDALRIELAPFGVHVMHVAPGKRGDQIALADSYCTAIVVWGGGRMPLYWGLQVCGYNCSSQALLSCKLAVQQETLIPRPEWWMTVSRSVALVLAGGLVWLPPRVASWAPGLCFAPVHADHLATLLYTRGPSK
jgi:hypothetical protein